MPRFRLLQSLVIPGLISFAAYASANDRLVATAPPASDVAAERATAKLVGQLPPEVQQDPAARVMRLQHLRRPILQRVKALPEARYRQEVRPSLGRQLKAMGFDDQDVTYFLTDLDRSRGVR